MKTILPFLMFAGSVFVITPQASFGQQGEETGQSQQESNVQQQSAAIAQQKPKTQLEQFFQAKTGSVVIKGYTNVGVLAGKYDTSISITALELTDASSGLKRLGLQIEVKQASQYQRKNDSYVDLDEIESLLSGIDYIAGIDKRSTKLNDFEAIYRTKGDLTIDRFTQKAGTMIAVESGAYGPTVAYFDSKDLAKLRELFQKGQARLQEIK